MTRITLRQTIRRQLISSCFLHLLLMLLLLTGYHLWIAPQIQTIDLKGYLDRQRELYQTHRIDDTTLQQNLAGLERIVASQPKNRILILKEVVLGTIPAVPLP